MTISKINNFRNPNFKRTYRYANEILVLSSVIEDFPFKVKRLVNEQADIAFKKREISITKISDSLAVIRPF